jgi:hypothetical protein
MTAAVMMITMIKSKIVVRVEILREDYTPAFPRRCCGKGSREEGKLP